MCSRNVTSTRGITVTSSDSIEAIGISDSTEDVRKEETMELSRRHRSLLAVLACASALVAAALPSTAAAAPRAHRSIVGGTPADPAQYPYAVAIFRKGHMHCSGSVIGPTRVLTAGHCVDGFNVANFQVIIGRPTLRDTTVGHV